MNYAVICHQAGDHSTVIDEFDSLSSALELFESSIIQDPEWDKENDVEGYELLEWDGDTIKWHSLID